MADDIRKAWVDGYITAEESEKGYAAYVEAGCPPLPEPDPSTPLVERADWWIKTKYPTRGHRTGEMLRELRAALDKAQYGLGMWQALVSDELGMTLEIVAALDAAPLIEGGLTTQAALLQRISELRGAVKVMAARLRGGHAMGAELEALNAALDANPIARAAIEAARQAEGGA